MDWHEVREVEAGAELEDTEKWLASIEGNVKA